MIGIGLVGYGHWGPNLARNFAAAGARIVAVSDRHEDRLRLARTHYPEAEAVARWSELVGNPAVDAVVVATPPSTHFEIAGESLAAGKHVLVEKPMTTSGDQACRLIDMAARRRLTLMVDHTYLYASSVQAIRRLIGDGSVGHPCYYDGIRAGPRPTSSDVDVVWDLAAHDVAIMDHLFGRHPVAVGATGLSRPAGRPVDDAYCTLAFSGEFIGHVSVSWRSPVKVRRTLIGGSRRLIVYDTMDPVATVKLIDWDTAADRDRARDGSPPAAGETLAAVAQAFLGCVATGRRPLADGKSGLHVVRVLEIASASVDQGGRLLRFPDGAPI